MKYSICDFSQAEITKFNDANPENTLDPIDLLIFQWFIDFAAVSNIPRKDRKSSKGMWKRIEGDCEYFYVKYDALIEEFPILGYQSVRSIQRRFDKYVATGLLCKKVFHEGRKGSFSYFGFTEKLFSLKYDELNQEQKINPHKNNSKSPDIQDKEPAVTDDKTVMSKDVTDDKTVMSKAVTDDKTVICYINNPTTNLKNSSTTSCVSTKYPSTEAAVAELLQKTNKIFGYDVDFQPNPYPVLVYRLRESEVPSEKWEDYLEWVYQYLKEGVKNKDKFDGYFFKSFTQTAMIQKYKRMQNKKRSEEQQLVSVCPVCSTKHNRFEDCPVCGLTSSSLTDTDEIRVQKQVWTMPEAERNEYRKQEKEIINKYLAMGVQAFMNVEVKKQQDEEIRSLRASFKIA